MIFWQQEPPKIAVIISGIVPRQTKKEIMKRYTTFLLQLLSMRNLILQSKIFCNKLLQRIEVRIVLIGGLTMAFLIRISFCKYCCISRGRKC